jgi:hypothetical protein
MSSKYQRRHYEDAVRFISGVIDNMIIQYEKDNDSFKEKQFRKALIEQIKPKEVKK